MAFGDTFKFNPKVALVAAGAIVLGLVAFTFLALLVIVAAVVMS
jgi:hypothetical protein